MLFWSTVSGSNTLISLLVTWNQIHDFVMYCLLTVKYKLTYHVKANLRTLAYENQLDFRYIQVKMYCYYGSEFYLCEIRIWVPSFILWYLVLCDNCWLARYNVDLLYMPAQLVACPQDTIFCSSFQPCLCTISSWYASVLNCIVHGKMELGWLCSGCHENMLLLLLLFIAFPVYSLSLVCFPVTTISSWQS